VNNFLDQLNLTPQERRIVVAIGMVVIVVLNLLFVWPHFGEWKRIRGELDTMRGNIQKYNAEIAKDNNPTNGLQKELTKLVRQEGAGVMDNQVRLEDSVRTQAGKTSVNVGHYSPGTPHSDTNGFFEEESLRITFDSQEQQLINFLYNIGGDPAMIRVSELDLSPQDQNRYRLHGSIALIANYTKPAAAAPAAPKPKPVPGTKAATAGAPAKAPPGAKAGPPSVKPAPAGKPQTPGQRGSPGQPVPGPNSNPRVPLVPQKKAAGASNL
jgi:hypothetical protein